MAKTIRELSEDLGVSKQAINRLLTKKLRQQHITTEAVNGGTTLVIDATCAMLIKQHFDRNGKVANGGNELVTTLKDQIALQKEELRSKNE